ncbi:MAG: sporulation protein [candidate division Zixibacteria bacterium]|nr:sporulation protein [candidate division Zixibacteria bacterium]
MPNNVEEIMRAVVEELRSMAKTESIIGKPITVGDKTVIPVCKISVGFGAGGGEGEKKVGEKGFGGGGGGGASIEPTAFVIIDGDEVSLLPAKPKKFGDVVDLIPDIFNKVKDFKDSRKKDKESKSSAKEDDSGEDN